ncbi:MAG TPA: prohibitin family protein [Bacteroidota bacterium]|nr:prohibitin family protein [Bacteroidota bacterium]
MFFIFLLLVGLVAVIMFAAARKKFQAMRTQTLKASMNLAAAVAAVALLGAFSQLFTVIPAGHVGVLDFFGIVSETTLKSGINMVNPLAKVVKFSVQTKELKEQMSVLSREGLTIGLEISALYRLDSDSAATVYKKISDGDYERVILMPQFRSVSRSVAANFNASALYSTERERLGESIMAELSKIVGQRGVIIESTPLRNVALPLQLTEAIEQKQRADQESQRMEFILTKERQEADRKRVEAQGVADFQKIVATTISEQLLRWKGIEATLKIAESNNAKVVIIGSGKDGLPVILDTK